jgi:hypothetical protein
MAGVSATHAALLRSRGSPRNFRKTTATVLDRGGPLIVGPICSMLLVVARIPFVSRAFAALSSLVAATRLLTLPVESGPVSRTRFRSCAWTRSPTVDDYVSTALELVACPWTRCLTPLLFGHAVQPGGSAACDASMWSALCGANDCGDCRSCCSWGLVAVAPRARCVGYRSLTERCSCTGCLAGFNCPVEIIGSSSPNV